MGVGGEGREKGRGEQERKFAPVANPKKFGRDLNCNLTFCPTPARTSKATEKSFHREEVLIENRSLIDLFCLLMRFFY